MLCLAQVALTPLACASFSIPMICSSLNLLFISFCSFYLSRTTLFNCPAFGGQASSTTCSLDLPSFRVKSPHNVLGESEQWKIHGLAKNCGLIGERLRMKSICITS